MALSQHDEIQNPPKCRVAKFTTFANIAGFMAVVANQSLRAVTVSMACEWLKTCLMHSAPQHQPRQEGINEQKSKSFVRGPGMTWRIDRVVDGDDIVALCISGRITRQDVDTLRNVIEEEASAVVIDLKNVVLADREVVKFLAQRELNRTELRNCPPYIREWVTRERAEMMETSGDIEDA